MTIAVVLTARPSWAKLQPVVLALLARGVDVQVIACASALLERYGRVVDVVRQEFPNVPIEECWTTIEGANLVTSAKETGALLVELGAVLSRLSPRAVLCCADRHEVLAVAQAASYLHLPLLHLQGGERTGSIDDKVRDAISHLASHHFVATEQAKFRVYSLIGRADRIWNVGCPSIDEANAALSEPPVTTEELGGAGAPIDLTQPFVTVLFHPVTGEWMDAGDQMYVVLESMPDTQILVFWPGEDAGADAMSKEIRRYQDEVHTVRSLPPRRFLRLLTQTACLVGNSSAGIREASFLGTPVVNIGSRQQGRERAANVLNADHRLTIDKAVALQISHGAYPSSTLYGTGHAAEQIAEVVCDHFGSDRDRDDALALYRGVRGPRR